MGGWFVDIFVGYVITFCRIIARSLRARRRKDWCETSATVVGASCQTQSYMPRPVAEIVYTYRFDGGFYGGVDRKPFFLESSAKAYADQFTRGNALMIRVKPGDPEISFARDEDQTRTKAPSTSAGVAP
jgi:hypothetical protein